METQIEEIKAQYESNKEAVIEMLLGKVTKISLEVPKVVIQNFEECL